MEKRQIESGRLSQEISSKINNSSNWTIMWASSCLQAYHILHKYMDPWYAEASLDAGSPLEGHFIHQLLYSSSLPAFSQSSQQRWLSLVMQQLGTRNLRKDT